MSKVFMIRRERSWSGIVMSAVAVIGFIIINIVQFRSLQHRGEDAYLDFSFWIQGVYILLFMFIFGTALYRALSKPFELEVGDTYIKVKNRQVSKDDIRRIRVQGYFNPIIGIELKGKRLIPMDLCFQFNDNEDEVMPVIREWCDEHQIPVIKKNIVRLI